jgi:hypothetical protein
MMLNGWKLSLYVYTIYICG